MDLKITFLLLLSFTLSAATLHIDYIGKFSLFGKVAKASIIYTNNGKKYSIKVVGHGTGTVGYLTQHKKYIYQSIGLVKNNNLIPLKYIAQEIKEDYNKTKIYLFDYDHNRTLITKYLKKKAGMSYNIFSASEHKSNFIHKKSTKILKRVYNNDMVSVLFNKNNHLLNLKVGKSKLIYAVGSKDTQKGIIVKLINIIDGKYKYSVTLKKDYLQGGSAKVTFILDSNNILDEARLNGILFFGNATIKRLML